jgi:uncharacterized ferritin-like protein (DUF455 family)
MTIRDLFAVARCCLLERDPATKLALTESAFADLRGATIGIVETPAPVEAIDEPGRPERPRLIEPRRLAQRGLGSVEGRAALVHAIAHIEFNAINLAWDAVHRFRGMPADYYTDWVTVAADEARHFRLLCARLHELGHDYGDFDAHDGLWDMARQTADSCLQRMALVPRVLEARGLDVTPGMIARLRAVGDHATVEILELILREEVAHVAAGSRWFSWCCEREGIEAEAMFADLLERFMRGSLRGPFNTEARRRAGFSDAELIHLETLAA